MLHDARHTVATVLLILRQPERTVMSLMGWPSADVAKRYQHITDTVRGDVASQVESLIWEARTEGAAYEIVTVRRHSVATILKLVEDGLPKHGDADDLDLAEPGRTRRPATRPWQHKATTRTEGPNETKN